MEVDEACGVWMGNCRWDDLLFGFFCCRGCACGTRDRRARDAADD
jgi:hypothetical protein